VAVRRATETGSPRTAATRLQHDFEGSFGVDTIERFLHTSYDQFAGRATIPNFLPLLAERFARQRLHALARVEGKITDGKPTVLFLCMHNAGRSQMALGFFTHLAGDRAVAWSGGSEPGNEINPAAIAAMREVGIDITGEYPKPWTDEIVQAADVVITMGCGEACPVFPGKRYENWELPDPAGQGLDAVRPIRDDIEERIRRLLNDLNVAAPLTRHGARGHSAVTAREYQVAPMTAAHADAVLAIYQSGIDPDAATFDPAAPDWATFDADHLPEHRFVAELGGQVAGWIAAVTVSSPCVYTGVIEHSVYVADHARGHGIGRILLQRLITASEAAGIWTLQAEVFPKNTASLALHHRAGFRVVGVRERPGHHHGRWRDVVLLERRSPHIT
jgi:arsenate reductase